MGEGKFFIPDEMKCITSTDEELEAAIIAIIEAMTTPIDPDFKFNSDGSWHPWGGIVIAEEGV